MKIIARMTAMGVQRQVSQSGQASHPPPPDLTLTLLSLAPTGFLKPALVVLLQVALALRKGDHGTVIESRRS